MKQVCGSSFLVPGSQRSTKNKAQSTRQFTAYCLHLAAIFLLVAVIVAGLFYGMIAEVELRELKADKRQWRMILCDRALAEWATEKDRLNSTGGHYE